VRTLGAPVPWMARARCAGWWGFTDLPVKVQQAECRQCPVRFECREYGINEPLSGDKRETTVWGGLSYHERADEKRNRLQVVK
jgi:hypothetical protein